MKPKQVPLKKRDTRDTRGNDSFSNVVQWSKSLPFFNSSRAVLIHRVEAVTTYIRGERRHTHVAYVCLNGTTAEGEFLAEPPANRLLCQACELMAKRKGIRSADELVGHHVHVGKARVERVCCQDMGSN